MPSTTSRTHVLYVLCSVVVVSFLHAVNAGSTSKRWASTGGGWKSMFANVAIANVLQQANVLSDINALSTNSGATWFLVQFAFSDPFYQTVTTSAPSDLGDFVSQWMTAYKSIFSQETYDCPTVPQLWSPYCPLLVDFNGNWADFTTSMLGAAAQQTYGDETLVSRTLIERNVVDALQASKMVLHAQLSLAPNAQDRTNQSITYLGSKDEVFTCAIAAQYEVSNTTGGTFVFALPSLPFVAIGSNLDPFTVQDFDSFGLVGGTTTNLNLTVPYEGLNNAGIMAYPFDTTANVAQVAAASSAALATLSPIVPSVYAQISSVAANTFFLNASYTPEQSMEYFASLYSNDTADGFAVCSQYPNPCGSTDLYFLDGFYTDDPSIAMDLGNHLTTNGGSDSPIKYLLINADGADSAIVAYFASSLNQNVAPGDVLWAVSGGQILPSRSTQIFQDELDTATLLSKAESIEGLPYVTTVSLTATTVDNPAFGVVAGQAVELLIVNLKYNITSMLFTPAAIDAAMDSLVTMTTDLASSTELLNRIQAFFQDGGSSQNTPSPAGSPTPGSVPTPSGDNGGGQPTSGAAGTSISPMARIMVWLPVALLGVVAANI